MVESSGLLNRRRVKSSTGGSNPPLSASLNISKSYRGSWHNFRYLRLAGICDRLTQHNIDAPRGFLIGPRQQVYAGAQGERRLAVAQPHLHLLEIHGL